MQVPADEQGVGHEEDCKAIRLRDEVVEKGEPDGNCAKSFKESHTISCPDDELVEKAAHKPLESIREFRDITWRLNEAFVDGNENDPPGPEKLALGNVKSGAFWARVRGRDIDEEEADVEFKNVGDGSEIVVSGDCSALSNTEGMEDVDGE